MEWESRVRDIKKLGRHAGAEENSKEDEEAYIRGIREGWHVGLTEGLKEGIEKAEQDIKQKEISDESSIKL